MGNQPSSRHIPVLLLLLAAFLVGVFTVGDYGESWDEADIRRYGAYAGRTYEYILHPGDLQPFETNLNLYGPMYFIAAGFGADLISHLAPGWPEISRWHLVYFSTYLLGAWVLYLLALRWMSNWAALGAVLLFLTQPLLWGHAFINPKDLPFLTFFLMAVYFGFRMVDGFGDRTQWIPRLVLSAIFLGVASSLRVLGPLAGILVLLFASYERRFRWWPQIAIYLLAAGLIAYLSWPYLWGAPVRRLLESITTMADFPFNSMILFRGHLYKADRLPAAYLPTILAMQLTESALVLIAAGAVQAVVGVIRRTSPVPFLLLAAWFVLPVAAIVALRSPLYDNARQVYFLLPPLFISAGLGLEALFSRLHHPVQRGAILIMAALPGLLIGARLHPYEYAYYNALVGGTGGAFRQFETDYWGTSFDEISRYLNSELPAGSKILVYGPEQIIADRARKDLQVFIPREDTNPGYDYVVLLTRSNADQRLCRGTDTLFSVGRRGAVFSELRRIPPGTKCQ